MFVKLKFFALGVIVCILLGFAEKKILSHYSPVYMMRNPQMVSDTRVAELLKGNVQDRDLAYFLLERKRLEFGKEKAMKDLHELEGNLWIQATDYLASIGERSALDNLRKIIASGEYQAQREKRIFYLKVMGEAQ